MVRIISYFVSLVMGVSLFSVQCLAQLPTATLSGTQTVCQLVPANLKVTFTGASPWNISYSDGTTVKNISNVAQNPYVFQVYPFAMVTYTLVSVSNGSGNGIVSGSAIITVTPVSFPPTPSGLSLTSSGPNPIYCPSGRTILNATSGNIYYNWSKGDGSSFIGIGGTTNSTFDITDFGAGYYMVSAIDASCVNRTGPFSTTTPVGLQIASTDPFPKPVISGNNFIQCGSPNTILTATAGFFRYDWMLNNNIVQSGLANTITANTFGVGNYTVKVYDRNGCNNMSSIFTITETFSFMPIISPSLPIGQAYVRCVGGNNILTADPGFAKYEWKRDNVIVKSGIENTIDLNQNNYGNGSYKVTVYNALGCYATSQENQVVLYPVDKKIVLTAFPQQSVCNNNSPIAVYPYPSTEKYINYLWSDGTTGETLKVTQPGTYTLKATSTSGCILSGSIVIDPMPILNVSITPTLGSSRVCQIGTDKRLINIQAIVAPMGIQLAYQWYKDNVFYNTTLQPSVTIGTSGVYTVKIIPLGVITSSVCFGESNALNVVITNAPIQNIKEGCQTSSYAHSANGAINNQVYKWYSDAINNTPLYTSNSAIDSTYSSSLNSVYVSIYDQISGCETSRTNMYYILDPVKLSDQNVSVCADGGTTNTVLTADNYTGGTYKWYTVLSGGVPIYTSSSNTYSIPKPTQNKILYVDFVSARGCQTTSRAVINANVFQSPVLSLSTSNTCQYSSVYVTPNYVPGANYFLYGTATSYPYITTNTSRFEIQTSDTKTYYVSAYKTGCETTRTPITIMVTPIPTSTFTITPICNQSAIITYTGISLPIATYKWYFGDGTIISGSGAGPYNIRWPTSGSRVITLEVSQNGCVSDINYQQYTVPAAPVPLFTLSTTYCQNTTPIALTGSPTGGVFSGAGISGASYTPSTVGANTITYSYTNPSDACVYKAVKNVTVNPLPVVSMMGLTTAYCQSTTGVPVTISPAGGTLSGTGISGTTFIPSTLGQRTVSYTYKNANNCSNTATQYITVNPVPAVSFTGLNTTYCTNSPSSVLTGTPAGGTFSGTGVTGNTFTPSALGVNTITYSYTANGCGAPAVKTATVNGLLTPSLTIAASASPINCGQNVTFTASPTHGGSTPQYQWKVNGINIFGATTATYSSSFINSLDVITCSMASNEVCYSSAPVMSNPVSIQVNPSANNYYTNFDGISDRVQIPAKSNYNIGSGDFTIEAEVSLNPSSDPYEPILSRRFKTGSVTDGFLLYEANGRILIQLNNANYFSDQFGNIRDNFLHKIAVVRNSGVLKFYLDGTFIGSANSFNSINTTAALYAGYDPYDQFFLNGTISNVHFWSVGKNASELYQTNIPANAPGLLGNWKMNECAGQGVQDFGPLANHGVSGTTMAVEASDPQRVAKNFTYGMQNALNLSSGSNNAKHGEISNSGVYDFNQNFTIEAIIQGSNGAVSTFPSIFSKRNSASDGFGFGIYNGRVYVSRGGAAYYDTNTGYNLYAYPACAHVALTRKLISGTIVYGVYVNGVLTYSFINNSNINTSAPIWLGNDNGRNNVFNAYIDEIRIWNVFKTPADLAANINTVFNTSTGNLIGYYRFKEESHAQWIKDESAINNYGYLGSSTSSDGNDPLRTVLACYGNSRIATTDIAIDLEPADTLEAHASVYPNPFENTARLKIVNLDSDVTIHIIDAAGRLVYTKENHPANEELLFGDDFPQGMYIVQFIDQPALKPIKFIKVK